MKKVFLSLLAFALAMPLFSQSNVFNAQITERGFQNPVIPGYSLSYARSTYRICCQCQFVFHSLYNRLYPLPLRWRLL